MSNNLEVYFEHNIKRINEINLNGVFQQFSNVFIFSNCVGQQKWKHYNIFDSHSIFFITYDLQICIRSWTI